MAGQSQERDLLVTPFFEADDWGTLDLQVSADADLGVAAEGDALRQALILRLLTPIGSLAALGHAQYGSRLSELIGDLNTASNRRRARAFVLQAVAQEARVAEVLELTIEEPDQLSQDRLRIFLRVRPATGLDPVALGIEVVL